MRYASGKVLTPEGFIEGHVGFEDGIVLEVGKGKKTGSVARGIITPTLVNAHTHIADYIVPADLSLSLQELVAPPDGLKHRMLNKASEESLRKAMLKMTGLMRHRGISRFIDFREGGQAGSRLLSSLEGKPLAYIFGRPSKIEFEREELDLVLEVADGIGLSSISDWEYGALEELAKYVRYKKRRFAIHVSERVREDMDKVLDLKPSFVVHMTLATRGDIEACAQAKVPIVVCPRSNLFFGKVPPLADMLASGVTIALGTDNAMLNLPDMLTEMEFAGRILRLQGVKDVTPVIEMAIANGRKLLKEKAAIGIEPGAPCDFMVTRSNEGDPATDLVLRSSSMDPVMVCMGREAWRGQI